MFGITIDVASRLLILLLLVWILIRVVHNDKTAIIWADFLSVKDAQGSQRGDVTKLGQTVGVFLAFACPYMYADSDKVDPIGLAALLGVSLAYLGGVGMYSSYLRSKQPALPEPPKVQ
jgi:hypothetical protein